MNTFSYEAVLDRLLLYLTNSIQEERMDLFSSTNQPKVFDSEYFPIRASSQLLSDWNNSFKSEVFHLITSELGSHFCCEEGMIWMHAFNCVHAIKNQGVRFWKVLMSNLL